MSDYDNIQNALNHIDPQDRETWFRMGAAIKDELGENGFEMWDNWSRQSDNYKQQDAQSVWKSIKVGHIHIASLFKAARENGYRPEKPYTPPSAEELAKRSQIAQEKQQAEAKRIAQAHAKAEKTAYGIWHNASPANPKHAYAQSKGLDADTLKGIRQNEYQGKKQLIIPLYSEKKLVNVQIIDEDGNKKFLNGGQKQGAYTIIGDFKQNQQGIILAEGFATAASVHEATGKPVVVAFDAGNLKAVSEKLLNVLPENVPVYFAADQDPSQTGLHKAQAAAEVWGERAQILLPEFSPTQIQQYQQEKGTDKVPTDFNDLHKLAGINAVRERFGLAMVQEAEIETEVDFRQPEMEHIKPELSREELLKNDYWRVANGYAPLPETPKPEPQQNFRQPENPNEQHNPTPNAEPQTELPNKLTQTAISEKDVAISFSEKENSMENPDAARLDGIRLNWSESSPDTNLHFKDLDSLQEWFKQNNPPETIPKAGESYDKNNITLFLTDANGEKHEVTERIDVSVTGNDFNPNTTHIAEYRPMVELLAAYGIEQEKDGTIPQNQDLSEPDFRQPENERAPDFYNYNFEDLPKEPPQVAQNQDPNPELADDEKVSPVPPVNHQENQADEPEPELPNTIEYEAFQREIDPTELKKTEFRQPENPSVTQTPTKTELETAEPVEAKNEPERPAPEQEKSQANTGLDYTIPAHLQSRMVAVDVQRFRVMNHEMGAHLLRYTAPDNPKMVLFEDKGKTLHTARDDKQTIQDMLDVAKAKGWDSIKISGSQEFKQQMWLEAESRGIATKGYKPSPEDLTILERRREERATNSIAEAEKLKQQSAMPERPESTMKTIPTEAVKAADTVKAHATQAQQTNAPKPSNTAKAQYESKLATLPTEQQHKARFYERQALAAMRHMPAEFHEKTRQAIYENQSDLIRDGKYHAPDPMKSVERQPEKAQEKAHEQHRSRDDDWEMER